MIIDPSFRRYMEEAIGSENALVAFSAFDPIGLPMGYFAYTSKEERVTAFL